MEKPFRKISELVAALAEAEKGLNAGSFKLDGLETACTDARELFERLIVLRHKARESVVGGEGKVPEATAQAPAKLAKEEVEEATSLRLDTRPMEVSSRQTSLIEAIESTEAPAAEKAQEVTEPAKPSRTVKEAVARPKAPPSVAEKLEKAAVADLGKAISLSHKFWFVAELFNGDRITYEKSIEKLNASKNLAEAESFVQEEVIAKLKKPADPEAITTFTDLVRRRHA